MSASNSEDADRRVLAGASASQLKAAQQTLAKAGLTAVNSLQVFLGVDGTRKYSAVLSATAPEATLEEAYAGWERVDQPQWDVSLAAEGKLPDPLATYRQQLAQVVQALNAKPDDLNLRLTRAVTQFRLGDDEAALEDLQALSAKGVESPMVLQCRAFVLARLGKQEEAQQALEAFVNAFDNESTKMYLRVVVAAWLGQGDEARKQLDEAGAKTPADANLLYDAACAGALASLPSKDREADPAFVARAPELLAAAIEAGYQDGDHLRTDPDLAPLHSEPPFLELLAKISPTKRYAGLWRPDTTVESRLLSGLSPVDHLEQCRALLAEGYRPVSIAMLHEGDAAQAASVWHRPLIPDDDREQLAIRQSHAAVTLLRLGEAANRF